MRWDMANVLRANVRSTKDWWELQLLDLKIVADGATEAEMLKQLEHVLTMEYHLALKCGKAPFVNLLLTAPEELQKFWDQGGAKIGWLKLPPEVSQAIAVLFQRPTVAPFCVEESNVEAKAA